MSIHDDSAHPQHFFKTIKDFDWVRFLLIQYFGDFLTGKRKSTQASYVFFNNYHPIVFCHFVIRPRPRPRVGPEDRYRLKLSFWSKIQDMFVGATNTSIATMEWAMSVLIKNPIIMKKAQEEVREVVGGKLKVDVNDVNQMCYLKCIVKETLRLHHPLPFLVPRETSATAKLGGYDIPCKTRVYVNSWAIQRDPKFWDNAEEFLPERFNSKSNPIEFLGNDFQYTPFGCGRRVCPGMSFGLATVEYVLANLLYWFDWELPGGAKGEDLDMSEVFGLSIHKKVPLHLVATAYDP